jgi:hypothetical protein
MDRQNFGNLIPGNFKISNLVNSKPKYLKNLNQEFLETSKP